MLDLDLTAAGHSRSKQMPPNERPYDFISIINSNSAVILNRFGDSAIEKLCPGLTFQGHSKKDNGAK